MGVLTLLERMARWGLQRRGFESRHHETDVARIHVYDSPGRGALPPVVLLHGLGSNAAPYGRMALRLRHDARRIIAPELPGHGLSSEPYETLDPDRVFAAIADVLDRELDEPAVIFGNSLGGGVALRYGVEYAENVRGLVLSSPAGAPVDEDQLTVLFERFEMGSSRDAREFLGYIYDQVPWYAPLLAADIRSTFERPALRDLLESVESDHFATPEQLAGLDVPVLLLWGKSERLMPRSMLEFYRTHLPEHAIIEEPEGYAHSPYLEHPERLATRVLSFIEELDRSHS